MSVEAALRALLGRFEGLEAKLDGLQSSFDHLDGELGVKCDAHERDIKECRERVGAVEKARRRNGSGLGILTIVVGVAGAIGGASAQIVLWLRGVP